MILRELENFINLFTYIDVKKHGLINKYNKYLYKSIFGGF